MLAKRAYAASVKIREGGTEVYEPMAPPPAAAATPAKTKPVYGGAKTWVTAPATATLAGPAPAKATTLKAVGPAGAGAAPEVTAPVSAPAPVPAPAPAVAAMAAVAAAAAAAAAASSSSSAAAAPLSPLPGAKSKPELLRNEIHMLANDDSETALKAREATTQTTEQLMRDTLAWVGAVLHEPLAGADLHAALKSGDALCRLIRCLRPGAIAKFHEVPRRRGVGWLSGAHRGVFFVSAGPELAHGLQADGEHWLVPRGRARVRRARDGPLHDRRPLRGREPAPGRAVPQRPAQEDGRITSRRTVKWQ